MLGAHNIVKYACIEIYIQHCTRKAYTTHKVKLVDVLSLNTKSCATAIQCIICHRQIM